MIYKKIYHQASSLVGMGIRRDSARHHHSKVHQKRVDIIWLCKTSCTHVIITFYNIWINSKFINLTFSLFVYTDNWKSFLLKASYPFYRIYMYPGNTCRFLFNLFWRVGWSACCWDEKKSAFILTFLMVLHILIIGLMYLFVHWNWTNY